MRVEFSLPPGADARAAVIDAVPVLELASGQWIRGGRLIIQYLLETYRTFPPSLAGSSARGRSQSAIVSAMCEDQLLPLLYLYPSPTVTKLAGRPPVPMRSADKEKVFQDILRALDAIEGYASRSGPGLMGGPTMADALALPLVVFFDTFCTRLRKSMWMNKPKLRGWYDTCLANGQMADVINAMKEAIVEKVNKRKK